MLVVLVLVKVLVLVLVAVVAAAVVLVKVAVAVLVAAAWLMTWPGKASSYCVAVFSPSDFGRSHPRRRPNQPRQRGQGRRRQRRR